MKAYIIILVIWFIGVGMLMSWSLIRSVNLYSYSKKKSLKRFRKELKPGDHVLINGDEYIVKVIAKNIGMVSLENVKTRSVMGEDIENVYPIEK